MAVFHSMSQNKFLALVTANGLIVGDFYFLTDQDPGSNLFIACTNTDGGTGHANVSSIALTGKLQLGFDGIVSGVPASELLFTIDGAGQPIQAAGSQANPSGEYGNIIVPYSCTITGWSLLADQSGNAQLDVQKSSYTDFPSGFTSIVGNDAPLLQSAQKNENPSVSVWTTSLAKGDVLKFIVNSATAVTRLNLAIAVTASE